jgi:hypothetical protein
MIPTNMTFARKSSKLIQATANTIRDSHSARILRPLVTFADQIFFKIMNKQEYKELNLKISYFALLVMEKLISIVIDFGNVFEVDKLRNTLKITSFKKI